MRLGSFLAHFGLLKSGPGFESAWFDLACFDVLIELLPRRILVSVRLAQVVLAQIDRLLLLLL
jgi:hypothetical protein